MVEHRDATERSAVPLHRRDIWCYRKAFQRSGRPSSKRRALDGQLDCSVYRT
jgi:hypothetical protein